MYIRHFSYHQGTIDFIAVERIYDLRNIFIRKLAISCYFSYIYQTICMFLPDKKTSP
jgi:hypothetical protein